MSNRKRTKKELDKMTDREIINEALDKLEEHVSNHGEIRDCNMKIIPLDSYEIREIFVLRPYPVDLHIIFAHEGKKHHAHLCYNIITKELDWSSGIVRWLADE